MGLEEAEIEIWEEIAHRLQVSMEEMAGIAQKNIDAGYAQENDAGAHHSFALGQIVGILRRHVRGDWRRFGSELRNSDREERDQPSGDISPDSGLTDAQTNRALLGRG